MAKPEPSPDERLSRALSEAKSQLARPDEVARLWRATQARIAAISAAQPVAPGTPGATTIAWTTVNGLGLLGAVALFVGFGALYHYQSEPNRPLRLEAPLTQDDRDWVEAPDLSPRFEQLPRVQRQAQSERSADQAPPARAQVKRAAAGPLRATEPPLDELSLIEQADAQLFSSPRRALALLESHAQAFPAGALAQERELMLITALGALGRADAARDRAERFLTAYPSSPHRRRIVQLVQQKVGRPDNVAADSLPTGESNKSGGSQP